MYLASLLYVIQSLEVSLVFCCKESVERAWWSFVSQPCSADPLQDLQERLAGLKLTVALPFSDWPNCFRARTKSWSMKQKGVCGIISGISCIGCKKWFLGNIWWPRRAWIIQFLQLKVFVHAHSVAIPDLLCKVISLLFSDLAAVELLWVVLVGSLGWDHLFEVGDSSLFGLCWWGLWHWKEFGSW